MKRILLLATLFILSLNFSFGQTTDTKTVFASESSKFEANASRNRVELYENAYTTLDNMMQQEISQNKTELAKTTGTAKTKLADKIKLQEQYYTDIKALATDKLKNRTAIKSRLDQFQQSL